MAEYISVEEALKIYEETFNETKHISTMRNWASKYKLGIKVGGVWKIDKVKFKKALVEGMNEEA